MTPEQVSQIFKSLPKGTTDYQEIRIYLKGRQQPQTHDATRVLMTLRNNLLYINREPNNDSLDVSYTSFIDINEIQTIKFIR